MAERVGFDFFIEIGEAVRSLKEFADKANAGKSEWEKFSATAQSFSTGVNKSMHDLGSSFKKVGDMLSPMLDAWQEQEDALAKVDAIYKATGGTVGYTTEQLAQMASEMQKTTVFGDEMVSNAQAVLMTFNKVSGEAFPRAVKAAADLSATFGGDLDTNIRLVGKALQNPVDGLSAWSRLGIRFTEETKNMVTELMQMGDVTGAQNLILKEMEDRLGGAAEAMAKTGSGQVAQLKNLIGDMKEEGGKLIAVFLKPLIEIAKKVTSFFLSLPEPVRLGVIALVGFTATIGPLVKGISTAVGAFKLLFTTLAANPTMLVVAGVVALVAAIASLVSANKKAKEQQAQANREMQNTIDLNKKLATGQVMTREELESLAKAAEKYKKEQEVIVQQLEKQKKDMLYANVAANTSKLTEQIKLADAKGQDWAETLIKTQAALENMAKKDSLLNIADDINTYKQSIVAALIVQEKLQKLGLIEFTDMWEEKTRILGDALKDMVKNGNENTATFAELKKWYIASITELETLTRNQEENNKALEEQKRIISESITEFEKTGVVGLKNASAAELWAQKNTALTSSFRSLAGAYREANEENEKGTTGLKKWSEGARNTVESLGKSALDMVSNGVMDVFTAMGQAMATGGNAWDAAKVSLRGLVAELVTSIPKLLLSAGINLIGDGYYEVGLALVAASGLVALVAPAIANKLTKKDEEALKEISAPPQGRIITGEDSSRISSNDGQRRERSVQNNYYVNGDMLYPDQQAGRTASIMNRYARGY